MDYFLKASAIIILFYACYKLFLQRDTFFQANRWFLLIGLFIAIVLPLVIIPIYIEYTPRPIQFFETSAITFPTQQTTQAPPFDYWQLLPFIYLAGVLFVTTKVTLQFISLNRLLKNQKKTKTEQFTFIETEANIAPFSFFNRIVFNSNQFTKNELEHIITHEKVHAKQLHSIDILLTQIATILFWFNPCIWLYKKAMQQNLEFIADHEAQNTIACSKSYQTVLLKASLTTNQLAVTNNFYQSLIKKRIVMLQKSQSKKSNQLKFTIVLPFLALFLMSFNIKEVYIAKAETMQDTTASNIFTITSNTTDQEIKTIKDQLEAQTDGLKIKFSNLKRNNFGQIIYLAIASKNIGQYEFEERYISQNKDDQPISNTLIKVDKNQIHIITNQNNTMTSISKDWTIKIGNNEEVINNIKEEDQLPHKTVTLLPNNISQDTTHATNSTFKLNSLSYKQNNKDIDASLNEYSKPKIKNDSTLVLIDGKKTSLSQLSSLDPNTIKSMTVITDKEQIKKYGSEKIDHVIILTTKDSNLNTGQNPSSNKKNNPWSINYEVTKIKTIKGNSKEDDAFISNQLNTIYSNKTISEKALLIVNGKKTNAKDLRSIDPSIIDNISVLKDEDAIEAYGEEGKNGVIILKTSTNTENNSWDVNYGISSTTYTDDETPAKNNMVLHITKNTPDLVLEQHKKQLESLGKKLEYLTLRRNSKKEITKLKMSITNNKGANSKVLYQSNKGIPAINITIDAGGEVNIESQKQD